MGKGKPSFEAIYNLVNENWDISQENYITPIPEDIDLKTSFAAKHIHMHLSEIISDLVIANAEIAKTAEGADHYGVFEGNRLRQSPKRMIVNALKLADTLGISPEELTRQLMKWAAQQRQSHELATT